MVQLNKAPWAPRQCRCLWRRSLLSRRSEGRAALAELRRRWPKGGKFTSKDTGYCKCKYKKHNNMPIRSNKHKNLRKVPKIGNFDALRCRPRVLTIDVRSPAEFEAGHIPGAEHPSVTLRVSAEMFTFMRYVSSAPYLVPRKWVRRNHLGFFQNTPLR